MEVIGLTVYVVHQQFVVNNRRFIYEFITPEFLVVVLPRIDQPCCRHPPPKSQLVYIPGSSGLCGCEPIPPLLILR